MPRAIPLLVLRRILSGGLEYINVKSYAVCCRVPDHDEAPAKHAGSEESRTLDEAGQVLILPATSPVSIMDNPAIPLIACLLATKISLLSASFNSCFGIVKP